MQKRTEADGRLFLASKLVFLFCRPILPYYNKGKLSVLSCQSFLQIFFDLCDYVAIFCKLRASEKLEYHGLDSSEIVQKYWELTGDVGLEQMIDRNIRKKTNMSEYLKKVSLEDMKKEL